MEDGSQEGTGRTGVVVKECDWRGVAARAIYWSPLQQITIELDPTRLAPLAITRILSVYRTGILTNGDGFEFLTDVLGTDFPFVKVETERIMIPTKEGWTRKRRPGQLTFNNLTKEMRHQFKNFHIQDKARWKIVSGGKDWRRTWEPTDGIVLSGLMTIHQLRFMLKPILMTPERTKLGNELAEKFLSTKKYILTYKDHK